MEFEPLGLRTLNIYLGRTATPMIEKAFALEKRKYAPALLLQPLDVARLVAYAIDLPQSVELTDASLKAARASY